MQPAYDAVRHHAYRCVQVEACTTADLAAQVLACSPDAARSALKLAADAGYFRTTLLAGLGNKVVYQPTPKAAHFSGSNVPKFLRSGLSSDGRRRGLLRGFIHFAARSELSFLPVYEQSARCAVYGIQERGHARSIIGLDGAHAHIFVPVLKSEKPAATIEAAVFRWLPALELGASTLHFVAAPDTAALLRDVLNALAPPPIGASARDELAQLDLAIAADKSGLAAIKLAARRSELAVEVAVAGEGGADTYSWIGQVWEAVL